LLILRETFFYRVTLVYRMAADEMARAAVPERVELSVRRYHRWDDVEPGVREMLAAEPHDFGWDFPKLLGAGWELWAGFVDGRVASLCWTRGQREAREFWARLGPHDMLMGPAATAPAFRGRGIFTYMLGTVARQAAAEGVEQFWVSCLQSNVASRRAIRRNGFVPVGRAVHTVLGGHRWTAPNADFQENRALPRPVHV
jgi:RimJ/RimL family protein N-acetyltransferase